MSKHRIWKFCLVGFAVCLLSGATPVPAHAQQGIGERIGEQLDRGVDRLSSELREGWASLRKSIDRMGVQGRVYSRLRWDKQIATSKIDVDVRDEDIVVLRGRASNAAAKRKATQLAEDTVGVSRVIDELTVEEEESAEQSAEIRGR